jgi:hypothetical protein
MTPDWLSGQPLSPAARSEARALPSAFAISSSSSSALDRSPFRTAFAAIRARCAVLLHLLHLRRASMRETASDASFSVGDGVVSLGFGQSRAFSNPAGVAVPE